MPFPRPILILAGCLVLGFLGTAVAAYLGRGIWIKILGGIFLLTLVSFFATMSYLAPKYGTKVGRSYTFDKDSPMSLYLPLGIVCIMVEGGILYCLGRHLF
jgi:hypothetical protein